MAQVNAVLAAVVLLAVIVLPSTSAFPMKRYRPRLIPPVRLTIHAPVSGADIALARAQALQPFLNPGIAPVGEYVYVDDVIPAVDPGYPFKQEVIPAVDPGYPFKQDVKNHIIVLNKPELENVNIGGHPGQDFY